jgi:formate hydrogenlyase subunit 7
VTLRRALGLVRRTGRVAEPSPPCPDPMPGRPDELSGTIQIRHVDCGSCNGCEIEIANAFGPVYDLERYGARLVASPRHADVVLATGVVTRNMLEPLKRTVDATPRPRLVIALGDCACDGGLFAGGYGVVGSVGDVVDVHLEIPGCPPEPEDIVRAVRSVTGR